MNLLRVKGVELAAHASLFECIDLALDLSAIREDEVEVIRDGVKVAGFRRGHRVFPPGAHEPPPALDLGEMVDAAMDRALRDNHGNVTLAAQALGMGRTTFYRRLKQRAIPCTLAKAA